MIELMPRPRLPHIVRETTRHGRVVWYFRRGKGRRFRLAGQYGSQEFLESYRAAEADISAPSPSTPEKPGTVAWLVTHYMETSEWSQLAPVTRKNRGAIYKQIVMKAGMELVNRITASGIQKSLDRRTPHSARGFLKAIRPLFNWAVRAGYLKVNPVAGIKAPKVRSEGYHTWTEEEVASFETQWPIGTKARLALDIMLYTGLRRSDAVRLGRQHIKAGEITLRTSKTGAVVYLPLLAPLARSIAASATGDMTFLVTAFNRPFTAAGFGNWFRDRCVEAGVPGRAHGLRKIGAVRAAENGATALQLQTVFGWESAVEATRYTKAADRKRIARDAAGLLIPPHLQTRCGQNGGKGQ